jgi:hypothetical protein
MRIFMRAQMATAGFGTSTSKALHNGKFQLGILIIRPGISAPGATAPTKT